VSISVPVGGRQSQSGSEIAWLRRTEVVRPGLFGSCSQARPANDRKLLSSSRYTHMPLATGHHP
jgi:hypothetical protein